MPTPEQEQLAASVPLPPPQPALAYDQPLAPHPYVFESWPHVVWPQVTVTKPFMPTPEQEQLAASGPLPPLQPALAYDQPLALHPYVFESWPHVA